ncbi:hypothetical protein LAZ40_16205 [Cereibacter sphaeroides]|uniref:hypothetical protein n=1 Tax=Cereibacter sphaeroides TaxID=1063 RepID=UPI001F183F49|nr:hypothetical protein [Cereibacter sphaeroides]MCE6960568.1 hypothetical protein [Cereibacter sphaeroides]MCE6972751.1 hypothetical protein [Cereibacter sphaeroides]
MADTRHITSSDGRHRVAYEMAMGMWSASNDGYAPKVEDREAFLGLVKDCTKALAWGEG